MKLLMLTISKLHCFTIILLQDEGKLILYIYLYKKEKF